MLYRACYDHATENSHGTAITLLQWVSGCFLNISITTGISGTWSFYGDLGRKSMHRPRASSYVAILSVDCASRSREWASTAIDAAFTDDANEKAAHEPAASPVRYGRSFRATLLDIRQRQNRARDRSTSRAHNKQLDKCMTDKGGKWVQSGCYSPAVHTHSVCDKGVAETSSFIWCIFQLYSLLRRRRGRRDAFVIVLGDMQSLISIVSVLFVIHMFGSWRPSFSYYILFINCTSTSWTNTRIQHRHSLSFSCLPLALSII